MPQIINDPDHHLAAQAIRLHVYLGEDGAAYAYADHRVEAVRVYSVPFATPLDDALHDAMSAATRLGVGAVLVFDPLGALERRGAEPLHPEELNASNDG